MGPTSVFVSSCLRFLLFLTLGLQLSKLIGELLSFGLIVCGLLLRVGDPLLELSDFLRESLVNVLELGPDFVVSFVQFLLPG